jgi:Na+-driven multidrug efflux pump
MNFTLVGQLISSYFVGLPAAVILGICIGLNASGVFGARAIEELVKVIAFLLRFKRGFRAET